MIHSDTTIEKERDCNFLLNTDDGECHALGYIGWKHLKCMLLLKGVKKAGTCSTESPVSSSILVNWIALFSQAINA